MRIKAAFLVTRNSSGGIGIGDSIVIMFDDYDEAEDRMKCIVIDGGYSGTAKVLRDYLGGENISVIDLVVATHIDDDHVNGLAKFFKDYVEDDGPIKVLNYWGPAPKSYTPVTITEFLAFLPDAAELKIDDLTFVSQGVASNEELWESAKKCVGENHIRHPSVAGSGGLPALFKSVKIEILAPEEQVASTQLRSSGLAAAALGETFVSEAVIDLAEEGLRAKIAEAAKESDHTANNQSIVFRLTPLDRSGRELPDRSFLFPGDAGIESWNSMIDNSPGLLKARYLKVSHHGSVTGTNEAVLSAVRPDYGIICAGKNKHGLPDGPVLKLMQDKGVKIICTGRNPKVKKKAKKDKAKDTLCASKDYKSHCPRWDGTREIEDPVVFEFDTERPLGAGAASSCGNTWP